MANKKKQWEPVLFSKEPTPVIWLFVYGSNGSRRNSPQITVEIIIVTLFFENTRAEIINCLPDLNESQMELVPLIEKLLNGNLFDCRPNVLCDLM